MFGRKRASASEALTAYIVRRASQEKAPWTDLFYSMDAGDGWIGGTGFYYAPDGAWRWGNLFELDDGGMEALTAVRDESVTDPRGPWSGCLIRLRRGDQEPDITFLYGAEAQAWELTPTTLADIVERARPV